MEEHKINLWLARDGSSDEFDDDANELLWLFDKKPYKIEPAQEWFTDGTVQISVPKHWFMNVRFDNEPIEVEITIKRK